jgi:hypothetical protein
MAQPAVKVPFQEIEKYITKIGVKIRRSGKCALSQILKTINLENSTLIKYFTAYFSVENALKEN